MSKFAKGNNSKNAKGINPNRIKLLFLLMIKIKIKKLDEGYNYFSLIFRCYVILSFVQKISQMLKTSI